VYFARPTIAIAKIRDYSQSTERTNQTAQSEDGDIIVLSIHWGGNWGFTHQTVKF